MHYTLSCPTNAFSSRGPRSLLCRREPVKRKELDGSGRCRSFPRTYCVRIVIDDQSETAACGQ